MATIEHVFIAGLHRSGTSLLHRCLGEHPEISVMCGTGVPEDEGQHLQTVYPRASRFGGPGSFGFAPQAHLTEDSSLVTEENRLQLQREWAPYWEPGKRIQLEKTPQNLIQTRFLQAMFPASRFIVLTRHPLAVAYATRKWNHGSLYDLLRHWFHCHEVFEGDRTALQHVLLVRYEDLVDDPTNVLQRVYGFLGLPPQAPAVAVRGGVNERYFDMWRSDRSSLRSRAYTRFLMDHFEDRAAAYGYTLRLASPCDTTSPRRAASVLAHCWCQIHRQGGSVRRLALRGLKRIRKTAIRTLGRTPTRRAAVH